MSAIPVEEQAATMSAEENLTEASSKENITSGNSEPPDQAHGVNEGEHSTLQEDGGGEVGGAASAAAEEEEKEGEGGGEGGTTGAEPAEGGVESSGNGSTGAGDVADSKEATGKAVESEGTSTSVSQPEATPDGGNQVDATSKAKAEPEGGVAASSDMQTQLAENPTAPETKTTDTANSEGGAGDTQTGTKADVEPDTRTGTETKTTPPVSSEVESGTGSSDGPGVGAGPGEESKVPTEVEQGSSHPETGGGGGGAGGGTGETTSAPASRTREKKSRRKSRRSSSDRSTAPALRKRTSRMESRLSQASGVKHLELAMLSLFQPSDPEGTGYIQPYQFWELLQSSLQLTHDEVMHLQGLILPEQSGLIPYAEFANHATDFIASLYTNHPPAEAHWVELSVAEGGVTINYNKQTGEVMDKAESGIDVFAGVIEDLYQRTDSEAKGHVTWKMFSKLLQSGEMSSFLQENDYKEMQERFKASAKGGKVGYNEFCVLARDLILRVYRAKDPSDNPWCKISSPEFGEVWFNKFTGETHRGLQQTTDNREQEIAFVNEAYAQVQEINFELEQYREQGQTLSNQLAKSEEEQEVLAAQLYDTGRALDDANNEIIRKENELEQMKAVVENRDQQMELVQDKLKDMEILKTRLLETEQELQNARDTIANRDSSITERDTNIMTLQRQTEAATDELKTAHGHKDAQESALGKLQHQLHTEQKKLKEYELAVPELESDLTSAKEQLENAKRLLEEKTGTLGQTRKHLKNARERNMALEKDMEKLSQTHEKLCGTESEIRTLKTFLTTKTALIEKHKKDLREARTKIADLEEKDRRRAVILADVLEKTARQYQQQLGRKPQSVGGAGGGLSPPGKRRQPDLQVTLLDDQRPYSAPAVPPEDTQWGTEETDYHSPPPGVRKSFTTASGGPSLAHSRTTGRRGRGGGGGPTKARTRGTIPKLPLISTRTGIKQQRTRSFVFSTTNDLKRERRLRDSMVLEHTPSNPQCMCQLCRMNAGVVGNANRRPETGLTGMTTKTSGLPGYHGETDVRELALAEQLRIGQRVLVRVKKSEFDLEPTKLTGIIKYVGKIDSEFVDHRIYVGVKLDEAVGDTDGLIKTKRYFTCPSKHGKIVRITNVIAVLPHKSVFYKSLQDISKRSPYTAATATAAAHKKISVQV